MSKRVNPSINAVSALVVGIITAVLIVINVLPVISERLSKRKGKAIGDT